MICAPYGVSHLLSHAERGEAVRAHVGNRGRDAIARAEHDDRLIEERAPQEGVGPNFV